MARARKRTIWVCALAVLAFASPSHAGDRASASCRVRVTVLPTLSVGPVEIKVSPPHLPGAPATANCRFPMKSNSSSPLLFAGRNASFAAPMPAHGPAQHGLRLPFQQETCVAPLRLTALVLPENGSDTSF